MHVKGGMIILSVAVFLLLFCSPPLIGAVQDSETTPANLLAAAAAPVDQEWVTEKNGQIIPLDTPFVDENGTALTLREIIDRPTLILPIYFYCPNACSKNLANLAVALNRLSFEPGNDYRVIALSFSNTEKPVNALRAKKNYLKLVYDQFPEDEWKFLTGTEQNIQRVTDALGYRFKKLDDQTYLHPSTIITVDATGTIIRYVYGTFVPGDVDMAISNAQKGIPALSVKRFLDFCFNYDPSANNSVFTYVKIGVLSFFSIAVAIVFFYFGRRKRPERNWDKN